MTAVAARTRFLWLEITGKCQEKCKHCCASSGPNGDHGSMTVDDWKSVIDQGAGLGVRKVQFIGGEPTLHPGLIELIRHALSRALAVEVFSNLVKVTPEQWTAFRQPGVSLATSWYSDDPDQHAAITGVPTYGRIKENIDTAHRLGIPLRVGVIDVIDGQRVEQAQAELVGLGIPQIGYDRVREVGRVARSCSSTDPTQLCGRCGDGVAAITSDGAVRPCTMTRHETVGHLHTVSLAEALAGMGDARRRLIERGMREKAPGTGCKPAEGDDCYPHNV